MSHVIISESPKTILHCISLDARASAATRSRAARLLGELIKNKWPHIRRQSRESALKAIAGDRNLSSRHRLNALQQLLFPDSLTPEERAALSLLEQEEEESGIASRQ